MNRIDNRPESTYVSVERVLLAVEQLCDGDCDGKGYGHDVDGWTYAAVPYGNMYKIQVFDEDHEYIGHF